ncbi:esterase/lipase family protein [Paraburkholderia tagetis]|uniref:GPI inositol-deacylase n=1 Tax=Paraburkholderia tagetis TaxID=2913261 RepID=A0A9X1RU88_9BURK|nr:GPI inositol-deacylase [Paraburkholderia tagetis]MCG5075962.1 GPI inositol-deacylase [Paraburkholderia tagetis]
MATNERIIPARIAEDGSVHYTSVTSPPDNSTAVCYMVPQRVIPVIFVPGVMGSNLFATAGPYKGTPVWLVNRQLDVFLKWVGRGPETRKQKLDPKNTVVYDGGEIPSGTALNEAELRRRGWGTVAQASYGTFLPFLENTLNDAHAWESGLRVQLMRDLVATAPGVSVLSRDEVALSYKYCMPVHAVGYNWLQSNADSAKHLADKIREFTGHYKRQNKICEKVIIVTHSMGGLVARYYSEVDGHRDNVLGIVHGVMPTTGSATAYKRVVTGSEGVAGPVLGPDNATVTPVFAQSPGPLQLLPAAEYGMGWLKIRDGSNLISMPVADPYAEIYLRRGTWWGLVDDKLTSPLGREKTTIDADWAAYVALVSQRVQPFHEIMCGKFHRATYVFYGDDQKHRTWGDIVWQRMGDSGGIYKDQNASLDRILDRQPSRNSGTGTQTFSQKVGRYHTAIDFKLQNPQENGDGTVPIRSGCAPAGGSGVQVCVAYQDVEHEGAYKGRPQQLFALWAVTRIVANVKGTSLEYK